MKPLQHRLVSPAAFASLAASLNMCLNPIPAIPVFLFHGNVMAAMCALLPQRDNCGMRRGSRRSWRRTPTRAAAVMSAGQVQRSCSQAAVAQR